MAAIPTESHVRRLGFDRGDADNVSELQIGQSTESGVFKPRSKASAG